MYREKKKYRNYTSESFVTKWHELAQTGILI